MVLEKLDQDMPEEVKAKPDANTKSSWRKSKYKEERSKKQNTLKSYNTQSQRDKTRFSKISEQEKPHGIHTLVGIIQ